MGIRVQKERNIVQGQLREQSCDPDVRGAAIVKVKRDGANAVITWNISTHLGRVPRRRRTRSIYHDAALFPSLFYNIIIIIIIRSTINCYDAALLALFAKAFYSRVITLHGQKHG
jgi:hypothetical protein